MENFENTIVGLKFETIRMLLWKDVFNSLIQLHNVGTDSACLFADKALREFDIRFNKELPNNKITLNGKELNNE